MLTGSLVAACTRGAFGCKGKVPDPDAGAAPMASSSLGPALAPPPLRGVSQSAAPLPALPELTRHEVAAAAPVEPLDFSVDNGSCRRISTGAGVTQQVCRGSPLSGSVDNAGATALIAYAQLSATQASLPAVVDHRLENMESPVRNQGAVPACTAFTIASAIDHSIALWTGTPSQVSTMQVWSRYHEPEEHDSILQNLGRDVGPESRWPFAVPEANSWLPCTPGKKPGAAGCGNPINPARLAFASDGPVATFRRIERVDATRAQALKLKLAAGQDIVIAMTVPESFTPKGKAGSKYIPHYTTAPKDSGHAMLLAGYVTFAHGSYFLLHNSWGTDWGDGGYAWAHEATITRWTKDAAVIDAEPSMLPANHRGELSCAPGLVPDSLRPNCAPPCRDGSPRHAGVCATAGQCPASYVNLTGTCVLAAPSRSGVDPATAIAYACGPGGCAYTLPRTVSPSCPGNTCMTSCPAPNFRVAKAGGLVTCVE